MNIVSLIIIIAVVLFFIWYFSRGDNDNPRFGEISPADAPTGTSIGAPPNTGVPAGTPVLGPTIITPLRAPTNGISCTNPLLIPPTPSIGVSTRCPSNRSSKGESICRQTLEDFYGVPFPRIRPNFLRNPETGRNMELDCYNSDLKIACEYNGIQHDVYPNWTGASKEEFIKQVQRDDLKRRLCQQAGVYLITVPYTIPLEEIAEYVRYYLPHNYHKRLEEGRTE